MNKKDVNTSFYRWVIVAAGGILGCIAIGSMFSLPVLLVPISQDTNWSATGISTAMTVGFLAMAVGSMGWGTVSDRIGPRPVVLTGSILLALGLVLASRATSLLQFQLLFGLLVGGAAAAIMAPMMACVTGWFDTHRSLAVSLVSAGVGIAPMTMAPLVAHLVSFTDWRTTQLLVAGIAAGIMIPLSLLVRRPPALEKNISVENDKAQETFPVGQVLKSPQFIVLALTNFLCCATHSGPIFHTVSYAVHHGISMIAAVSIYSLEGFAGLGGRVAFGILGDKLGAKRVLVSGLLLQAFGALAYFFVREINQFYAIAALFGFVYAGIMPLYAVIARENFPLRVMGTVIGGTSMAGSFGMSLGPIVGGVIFDTFGSYGGLFIAAWIIGITAFLVASTFKPRSPEQPVPVLAR